MSNFVQKLIRAKLIFALFLKHQREIVLRLRISIKVIKNEKVLALVKKIYSKLSRFFLQSQNKKEIGLLHMFLLKKQQRDFFFLKKLHEKFCSLVT